MAKCVPAKPDVHQVDAVQPLIRAVCILPERALPKRSADGSEVARHEMLHDLMYEFAKRFDRPFLLNLEHGLMHLDVLAEDSHRRYGDMKPHERHNLWNGVREQLAGYLPAGQRVVSLLTGDQLRGFIALRFPTFCPLVGMASPQRRYWLKDVLLESNFALALALAGGEPVYGCAATATAAPTTGK